MNSKPSIGKLFVLTLLVVSIGLVSCSGMAGEAAMQVWIDQPMDGSVFESGKNVIFQAHARDVNGPGINMIHFYLNEEQVASLPMDATAPLVSGSVSWQAEAGEYSLYAVATNSSGQTIIGQYVHFSVIGPRQNGPDITKTFTPTIEITRTLTPTPKIITPTFTPTTLPALLSFTSSRASINAGECATLQWSASNVFSLTLNGAQVSFVSSQQVCPTQTTVYTLIAQTSKGPLDRVITITVSVNCPPPRSSNVANLTITGGNCSIHRVGEVVQVCITPLPTQYEFGWDFKLYDYQQAYVDGLNILQGIRTLYKQGFFSSGTPPFCYQANITEPVGYEALELRVSSDFAEEDWPLLWLYVVP